MSRALLQRSFAKTNSVPWQLAANECHMCCSACRTGFPSQRCGQTMQCNSCNRSPRPPPRTPWPSCSHSALADRMCGCSTSCWPPWL